MFLTIRDLRHRLEIGRKLVFGSYWLILSRGVLLGQRIAMSKPPIYDALVGNLYLVFNTAILLETRAGFLLVNPK